MENGLYFLCPECKKILKTLYVLYQEYVTYSCFPEREDGWIEIRKEVDSVDDSYLLWCVCPECGAVLEYDPEDLLVKVVCGEVLPVGFYWKSHKIPDIKPDVEVDDNKKIHKKVL